MQLAQQAHLREQGFGRRRVMLGVRDEVVSRALGVLVVDEAAPWLTSFSPLTIPRSRICLSCPFGTRLSGTKYDPHTFSACSWSTEVMVGSPMSSLRKVMAGR